MKNATSPKYILGWVLLLLMLVAGVAAEEQPINHDAQVRFPGIMAYEGHITDSEGRALPDGRYDFQFAIYTRLEAGPPIWVEEHQSVEVIGGFVQLILGRGSDPRPLDLPFDKPYYLGISFGDQPEMAPRMELTASAFAFRARIADEVPDASITDEKIANVSWKKITDIPADADGVMTVTGAGDSWSLRGNIKTQPPADFLGTTDFNDLVFKTDNTERVRLGKEGHTHVANHIIMQDDNAIGTAVITETTPESVTYEMRESIIFDEDGNDIDVMGADVGIGTKEPKCLLHVKGEGRYATATSNATEPLMTGKSVSEDNHIALFENTQNGDGIAIMVNAGTPGYSNNFVTFLNSSEQIVGRIEGETTGELHSGNWEFIWNTILFALDVTTLEGEKIGAYAQGDDKEGGAINTQIVQKIAVYLEWEINRLLSVGVAYNSSAGDYAEYLPRQMADEAIGPGDIVGVYGGRVTKSTKHAEQLFPISSMPIVLGNMPPQSEEHLYEKVAFMGQVLVKVSGPVEEGDYIIPSGLDDGTGIAVSPEMMTAEEYTKVVGRAWSASDDPSTKPINVAIGLNSGDVAKFVSRQNEEMRATRLELDALRTEVAGMRAVLNEMTQAQGFQKNNY